MSPRRRLADVARGLLPADLVLSNGRVLDDLTGEFVAADVAIYGDTIAGASRASTCGAE
jgi:adenine deaminase